jgi:hypothetical protein
MALDPAFVADCPYGPEALLIDEILAIDRDASSIVARMVASEHLPLTRDQRADPVRHPRHVAGGLLIHATGMLGFAHAYYVLDLRHADGWIGYGTHIHEAKFKKLGRVGEPIELVGTATNVRRIGGALVVRYRFRFTQAGEAIYEGEHSAIFTRVVAEAA